MRESLVPAAGACTGITVIPRGFEKKSSSYSPDTKLVHIMRVYVTHDTRTQLAALKASSAGLSLVSSSACRYRTSSAESGDAPPKEHSGALSPPPDHVNSIR